MADTASIYWPSLCLYSVGFGVILQRFLRELRVLNSGWESEDNLQKRPESKQRDSLITSTAFRGHLCDRMDGNKFVY